MGDPCVHGRYGCCEYQADPKPPTVEELVREGYAAISSIDTFAAKGHSRQQIDRLGKAIDALAARVRELERLAYLGYRCPNGEFLSNSPGICPNDGGMLELVTWKSEAFSNLKQRDEARGERDLYKADADAAGLVLNNQADENARLREALDRLLEASASANISDESVQVVMNALREGREGKIDPGCPHGYMNRLACAKCCEVSR